jgi:hypothetical protein
MAKTNSPRSARAAGMLIGHRGHGPRMFGRYALMSSLHSAYAPPTPSYYPGARTAGGQLHGALYDRLEPLRLLPLLRLRGAVNANR